MSDVGKRFNKRKAQWSLVVMSVLEPFVRVLEFGIEKYDKHNWKKGLSITQCTESMYRHLMAFMEGEDDDPESQISHIGHIMCNCMFILYYQKYKPECDDRGQDLLYGQMPNDRQIENIGDKEEIVCNGPDEM